MTILTPRRRRDVSKSNKSAREAHAELLDKCRCHTISASVALVLAFFPCTDFDVEGLYPSDIKTSPDNGCRAVYQPAGANGARATDKLRKETLPQLAAPPAEDPNPGGVERNEPPSLASPVRLRSLMEGMREQLNDEQNARNREFVNSMWQSLE